MARYYPWTHFRDDNWLKLALLTGDGIVRVRPRNPDVADHDSELMRQLRAESDLLTEIVPSECDLIVVAGAFTETLEAFRGELRQGHGRDGDQGWGRRLAPFDTTSRPTVASSGPGGFDSRNTWLYRGPGGSKMTEPRLPRWKTSRWRAPARTRRGSDHRAPRPRQQLGKAQDVDIEVEPDLRWLVALAWSALGHTQPARRAVS